LDLGCPLSDRLQKQHSKKKDQATQQTPEEFGIPDEEVVGLAIFIGVLGEAGFEDLSPSGRFGNGIRET